MCAERDLSVPFSSRDILHDHNLIKTHFLIFIFYMRKLQDKKNTAKYLHEKLSAKLISLLNFDIFDFN